ncbi:MAG: homoserine dehydrogenase, partial [Actinomycetales bacterium]
MSEHPEITVALLGAGTVGAQVARLLTASATDLQARVGAPLRLTAVAVRDTNVVREGVDPALVTDDAMAVATSGADIVVEVMGGIEPARSLILAAMEQGSSVVTANKALLAADGATLYEAAQRHGVDLYFEASVAGAIPLLRPIRESMVGDRIIRVLGIVNGTTNLILTRMDEQGVDYATVLAEAQRLGYAEADPTADVGGHDAAAKAAI